MDNEFKSKHGEAGISALDQLLQTFKVKGYLKDIIHPYKQGYEGYDPNQFYSQYLITFELGYKWLVHSTTSIRTDRIDIKNWDFYHLYKLNPSITKAVVVYPDSISKKDRKIADKYNKKIEDKQIYTSINNVISLSELYLLIEEHYLLDKPVGFKKDAEGNNFEELIVQILNDKRNLAIWNKQSITEVGYFYHYFFKILDGVGIEEEEQIKSIEATCNIPRLPTGGKPKTDVLFRVVLIDNTETTYTISCKRTSKDWVSVHQYAVERFIDVLGISDQELITSIKEFQRVGGILSLKEQDRKCLESKMPKYNKKLAMWVYGGIGGVGNSQTQYAQYIITYQNLNSRFSMYTLDKYVDLILKVQGGHFGTPFKWTFASGGKNSSIQFKGKIV